MAGLEHSPPPFFKRGPAPLALLVFYLALSLAVLVMDLKFHSLEWLRQVVHTVVYPVQRLAQTPAAAVDALQEDLSLMDNLKVENERLHQRENQSASELMRLTSLEQENARLRELLELPMREKSKGLVASVLYTARDPFARRVVISRGIESGIEPGQPVISPQGLIGQVTRVFPLSAEVTLLTDKNQVVPVRVVRTQQHSVVAGRGDGYLELRYLPANVDVQVGDEIVTSGLDGIFLPGMPVARVEKVERETAYAFASILCVPIGGPENRSEVIVLGSRTGLPERPPEPVLPAVKRGRRASKSAE